ncbi:nitroreductase family deazaflavin-dependent oxidoreductase [Kutzneria sp. CA-103260]|uniref:nitroreductase family deazaflavin-dependent oxidoreductase n=1 Tax=Kutzneria sp. CA-103260 TaxID=2802641 RepID=UPI001BAB34F4|nr:nitroreductase family deazaflavin-dependent oxidoreductase [Kutzneria sp. CA-103260]QUQ64874.1 cell entry (mce) related family protein [Kutzneria sp. CA-103260]
MTDSIDFNEMNRQVIAEFRANGGKAGGIAEGYPLVLVHHIGAKSGTPRVTPLVPYVEGDRIFIFASKGGSPENPAWFHNLVANPRTEAEYGTDRFPVVARVLSGAERDDIYAKQIAAQPQFKEYESNTDRVIPVIELERVS